MRDNRFYWWYAIFGFSSFILSFMLNSLSAGLTEGLFNEALFNVGALHNVMMFIVSGLLCLALFGLISRNNISRLDYGFNSTYILRTVIIAGVIGLIFFGVSEWIEVHNSGLRNAGEQVMNDFNIGNNFIDDILVILNIGLFAPVAEEIIFRGGIFNPIVKGLQRYNMPKLLPVIIGVLVSAYLFATSHGGGGQDAQIFLLAILGALAAVAMVVTKSLYGAILVHAVNNNAVYIYSVYKLPDVDSAYSLQLVLASLLCLGLCIPIGSLFSRILPTR